MKNWQFQVNITIMTNTVSQSLATGLTAAVLLTGALYNSAGVCVCVCVCVCVWCVCVCVCVCVWCVCVIITGDCIVKAITIVDVSMITI